MKYLINKKEQEAISNAIENLEKKSSAEIVTIIAKESDVYIFIPTLYAALGAFVLPWIFFALGGNLESQEFTLTQLIIFTSLATLGQIKKIKMLLIPSSIKQKRCLHLAQEQFFKILKKDKQQDGFVLLFVSEAEKYVTILTDAKIAQKIDNAYWQETIQNFILHVKAGNITLGYLESIQKISEPLSRLFPETPQDRDELTNHLIML